MGLDMYLSRKHYVKNWNHTPPKKRFALTVERGGAPYTEIDTAKVSHIVEQVAYWRKANAIHGWFVRECAGGVDDCKEVYIPKEKLRDLVALCKVVLAEPTQAKNLLPPTEGFFFGQYEVDEYYMDDMRSTVEQLSPYVSDEASEADGFYYLASW
jgi:hypothetical protein